MALHLQVSKTIGERAVSRLERDGILGVAVILNNSSSLSPRRHGRVQPFPGIKKAGIVGACTVSYGFLGWWRGHMHRFLAVLATVTCRLHGRYRVSGLWKVETVGLWGQRCVGKGTEAGWEAGRSELASYNLSGSATQAAEQSDNSPNALMCHVTIVS